MIETALADDLGTGTHGDPSTEAITTELPRPHGLARVWLLLDRSASMSPTAEPMRRAINRFLAHQSDFGDKGELSIIGFDDDGIELLADGLALANTTSLRRSWWRPSGATPILPALDATLDLVESSVDRREATSQRSQDHLLLVVTDGNDNPAPRLEGEPGWGPAMPDADRARRIDGLGARGVTVASLAGTVDGRRRLVDAGIAEGNVGHYLADEAGVESIWWWADDATTRWRCSSRKQRRRDAGRFFSSCC